MPLDRRQFIKASAAMVAAASLQPIGLEPGQYVKYTPPPAQPINLFSVSYIWLGVGRIKIDMFTPPPADVYDGPFGKLIVIDRWKTLHTQYIDKMPRVTYIQGLGDITVVGGFPPDIAVQVGNKQIHLIDSENHKSGHPRSIMISTNGVDVLEHIETDDVLI